MTRFGTCFRCPKGHRKHHQKGSRNGCFPQTGPNPSVSGNVLSGVFKVFQTGLLDLQRRSKRHQKVTFGVLWSESSVSSKLASRAASESRFWRDDEKKRRKRRFPPVFTNPYPNQGVFDHFRLFPQNSRFRRKPPKLAVPTSFVTSRGRKGDFPA